MLLPLSHSCLLKPARNTNPFSCCRKTTFTGGRWRQNSNGLNFIHGEKLLSDLRTWGIGGPCHYFVQVFDQTQLAFAIRYCKEHSMRYLVIGKGSNRLFDDMGYDGCIILNRIDFLEKIEPGLYRVGSGNPFNALGIQSASEGFTGLEFAGGIPGTVGGAAFINAGADGQETAAAIVNVEIITSDGQCQILKRDELRFGYRSSPFQQMDNLAAITAVTFKLDVFESARDRQQHYLERRRVTQPLGNHSAGSVFRNPVDLGVSAAELIERSGMKGSRIGGAMVSYKHANFFVNCGTASSQDMLELIDLVKETVYQKFGVKLKEEIAYIPSCSDNTDPEGVQLWSQETNYSLKLLYI